MIKKSFKECLFDNDFAGMVILKWSLENCESVCIEGEWCLRTLWPEDEVTKFCELFGVSAHSTPNGTIITNVKVQPYTSKLQL